MKKIVLAAILMMASIVSFGQFIEPGGRTVKIVRNNHQQPTSPVEPVILDAGPNGNLLTAENLHVVYARVDDKDTLLIVYLPEVDVNLMGRYYEITETRQGRKLVNNVRKVYPYAKMAGDKLKEFDEILASTPNKSDRDRLMKQAEDELAEQYTEELKKLTFSQGLILIRLIDRETGNTSYQLVRELRGRVRAFFYQGFARIWGYNLKAEFDPKNNKEDEQIDIIATLLEQGYI